MIQSLISSFNAGELSPLLESRTNLDKYRNGCKVLENFLITPYGPANRRAGLEYRGNAKFNNKRCRLIGLNLTSTSRVVLELGEGYMRFWKNGSLLTSGGSPVEATAVDWLNQTITPQPASRHPYLEADLREVRYLQINNVVYLTHPKYEPYRLSSYSDTNWTIGPVPWDWAPTLDQNLSNITITPSATTGTAITLTASASIFKNTHVNSFWQLDHAVDKGVLSFDITGNTTSGNISILGNWALQSFGIWSADVELQASEDGGTTWVSRRTYVSRKDANIVSSGTETKETLFRFKVSNWTTPGTTGTSTPRIQIAETDPSSTGLVRITAVASGTSATARVVKTLGSTTATSAWYEGAFSAEQGYPNCVGLHQARVIFGGTATSPNTIWGSVTNDFQNFRKGAFDSDSYSFTLASTTGGRINWLVSKTALLIGTSLDEWSLSASDPNKPLTATNVSAQAQSQYGSASLPALIINDTILYVQRMSRKVRELIYTWASESWVSNDITALAEHTTRTHIQEIAYQRVPDAVYWFVRGDGQLVSMTYEREQQVVGFARHITDGIFESVASINGLDGEDELWVLVNRTINGATQRSVERFRLGMREALDNGDKSKWFYLDSAVSASPVTPYSPATTISGLSHLNGKAVSVWGAVYDATLNAVTWGVVSPVIDPVTNAPMVVTGGQIQLQTPVVGYVIGLPYTSLLCPQRVNQDLADGTSQGRKMRIPRLNAKLYESFGGEYSADQKTWFPMVSRKTTDFMDDSPPILNEWTRLYLSSNWADGVDIFMRQALPIPFTIAAIVPVWEASEGHN
jgi:hypothetical protein